MKMSNKLLLGLLIVMLFCISAVLGAVRYYGLGASVVTTERQEVPQAPAVPEAPAPLAAPAAK